MFLISDARRRANAEAMEGFWRKNPSVIAFVGTGFAILLWLWGQALEHGQIPSGLEAQQLFERAFDADYDNRTYDGAGTMAILHTFSALGDVHCGIHTSNDRRDVAYDYVCAATLTDERDCARHFVFFVERHKTLGPLLYTVNEALARATLDRFGLLDGKACG